MDICFLSLRACRRAGSSFRLLGLPASIALVFSESKAGCCPGVKHVSIRLMVHNTKIQYNRNALYFCFADVLIRKVQTAGSGQRERIWFQAADHFFQVSGIRSNTLGRRSRMGKLPALRKGTITIGNSRPLAWCTVNTCTAACWSYSSG